MTLEEAKELLNNELLNTYSQNKAVAIDIVLRELTSKDTEINKLNNAIDRMAEYIYSKTDFTTCGNIKSIKEYFMKEDM